MLSVNSFGRTIAIVGFGVEGASLLNVVIENSPNTKIVIFDESSNISLSKELSSRSNIEMISGDGCFKNLHQFKKIFISPGISFYRPEVQYAIKQGSNVSSAMQLWADHKKSGTTIFITGTKGKSTTASLILHMLKGFGLDVILGGNIGIPMTDLINIDESPDYWIIEASSYQLAHLNAEPDIAIILNLFPEHLNWHGSVDQYYEDKVRLFRDSKNCFSIINANSVELRKSFEKKKLLMFNDLEHCHYTQNKFYYGQNELFSSDGLNLHGQHNMENICAVLSLLIHLNLSTKKAKELLQEFHGLPHRLEYVTNINGVTFINDSISTVPQSSIAAINTYLPQWVTVILGGFNRGLDWKGFAKWLAESGVNAIIGLPDTGHEIIEFVCMEQKKNKPLLINAATIEEAIDLSKQITPIGGVVLLSPAAPSFNTHKSYRHRGDAFKKYILSL